MEIILVARVRSHPSEAHLQKRKENELDETSTEMRVDSPRLIRITLGPVSDELLRRSQISSAYKNMKDLRTTPSGLSISGRCSCLRRT